MGNEAHFALFEAILIPTHNFWQLGPIGFKLKFPQFSDDGGS
ncbi:hypothetical protein SP28804_A0018 [Streptococcus pneumoniae CDC0288-04]|nr:hypothetical protein SP28804_A0018 [Streptococcus pneumoniae CDC0288-04]EJG57594.1 hypothetical protein AMCSP08_000126 [Streptococcus pneumoniae 2072047]EJG80371.1 hypothetical protein SPAR27_0130 [Streptococcus pneumoniae SPAR27]